MTRRRFSARRSRIFARPRRGAKDWQPTAWSPRTHLLYVPHQHLCMSMKTSEVGYIAGTPFVGASVDMYAGHGGYRGEFMAWDPVARKRVWEIHENLPVWSGALVTAGDVAFYGTMDRLFKAVDARTGKLLWQFRQARASSASLSVTRAPTANNMWPYFRALVAGPARSPMRRSTRACATPRSASPAPRRISPFTPWAEASSSCSGLARPPGRRKALKDQRPASPPLLRRSKLPL